MKLFVRTVLDGIFPVEMDAHANVEQLKLAIQTVKNYEPSLQQLYVSGQRIDTDPKLCIAKINGLVESGFVICLLKVRRLCVHQHVMWVAVTSGGTGYKCCCRWWHVLVTSAASNWIKSSASNW